MSWFFLIYDVVTFVADALSAYAATTDGAAKAASIEARLKDLADNGQLDNSTTETSARVRRS